MIGVLQMNPRTGSHGRRSRFTRPNGSRGEGHRARGTRPPGPRHLATQRHELVPEQGVLFHQFPTRPDRFHGHTNRHPIGNGAKLSPRPRPNPQNVWPTVCKGSNIRIFQQLPSAPPSRASSNLTPDGQGASTGPALGAATARPPHRGRAARRKTFQDAEVASTTASSRTAARRRLPTEGSMQRRAHSSASPALSVSSSKSMG